MRGEIECLFYAEFDNKLGPSIVCQYPENDTAGSLFKDFTRYIITKPYLTNVFTMVRSRDFKLIGCCQMIVNEKYDREKVDSEVYRGLICKLNKSLSELEVRCGFLSTASDKEVRILDILRKTFVSIKRNGQCTLELSRSSFVSLALTRVGVKTSPVRPWDLCIPLVDIHRVDIGDLGIQRILRFIDGISHVKLIAEKAQMDLELALLCIRHLVHFNVVSIISSFHKLKFYVPVREKIVKFGESLPLQNEAARYVASRPGMSLHVDEVVPFEVFELYCKFRHGLRFHSYHEENLKMRPEINPRALVAYGLIKGLIRCLDEFPLMYAHPNTAMAENRVHELDEKSKSLVPRVAALSDGQHSLDQISCELGASYTHIFELCKAMKFVILA